VPRAYPGKALHSISRYHSTLDIALNSIYIFYVFSGSLVAC
jgi:hypothetical protein